MVGTRESSVRALPGSTHRSVTDTERRAGVFDPFASTPPLVVGPHWRQTGR